MKGWKIEMSLFTMGLLHSALAAAAIQLCLKVRREPHQYKENKK